MNIIAVCGLWMMYTVASLVVAETVLAEMDLQFQKFVNSEIFDASVAFVDNNVIRGLGIVASDSLPKNQEVLRLPLTETILLSDVEHWLEANYPSLVEILRLSLLSKQQVTPLIAAVFSAYILESLDEEQEKGEFSRLQELFLLFLRKKARSLSSLSQNPLATDFLQELKEVSGNADLFQQLAGNQLFHALSQTRHRLLRYQQEYGLASQLHESDWLSLVVVVMSRLHWCNQNLPTRLSMPCLVPAVDLFNTGLVTKQNVVCLTENSDKSDFIVCRTRRPVRTGEEFLVQYRKPRHAFNENNFQSNLMHFMTYGLMLTDTWNGATDVCTIEHLLCVLGVLTGHFTNRLILQSAVALFLKQEVILP